MTDPSKRQAEWRLIYAMIVAGKSAKFADRVLTTLFTDVDERTPFELVRVWIEEASVRHHLELARSGNYQRLTRGLYEVVALDAETCSIEELEAVVGIGPKTSRFFMLWTRPGVKYAALDRHVLKFLGRLGHTRLRGTPPPGATYTKLERIFLGIAAKLRITARDLDWAVWQAYRDGDEETLFSDLAKLGIEAPS